MAVEWKKQENKDSNGGGGDFEVSYEGDFGDFGDFGGSYEDYGVIPEGYDQSFEDTIANAPSHSALLELDQNRKKQFAKHAWIKVVREINATDRKETEEGGEPHNVDHSASSRGGVKMERKKAEEKKEEERDEGFSEKMKPRRKNFVETRWPSESELEGGDLAEDVLVSLINN